MHLTSALAPDGHKSTKHYVILHYDARCELIPLPKSYADLQQQVKQVFNSDLGRFRVETDEFNLCRGKRVRVPDDAWDDVALLLGNLFIVPFEGNAANRVPHAGSFQNISSIPLAQSTVPSNELSQIIETPMLSSPPSISSASINSPSLPPQFVVVVPNTPIQSIESQPVPTWIYNEREGTIGLNAPFVDKEALFVKIGNITFETETKHSTKFQLQLIDEGGNNILTIDIFPEQDRMLLASSSDSSITDLKSQPKLQLRNVFSFDAGTKHHIIVWKDEGQFFIQFDSGIVATLNTQAHRPVVAVRYDLGTQSPFKGPILANIYPTLPKLFKTFGRKGPVIATLDKDTLYGQILASDPQNAAQISKTLETIRKEITDFKRSGSGTKWRGHQVPCEKWTDVEWNLQHPHSILVLRYCPIFWTMGELKSPAITISFGPHDGNFLRVIIEHNQIVRVGETATGDTCVDYHTFGIDSSMGSGEFHSLAFVNCGDKIVCIFDFKQSAVLPKNTTMKMEPQVYVEMRFFSGKFDVDVYEFSP